MSSKSNNPLSAFAPRQLRSRSAANVRICLMIFISSIEFYIILMFCYYHCIIIQKTSPKKILPVVIQKTSPKKAVTKNVRDNVRDDEIHLESPVDRVAIQPVNESSLNKLARSSTASISKAKKSITIASHDIDFDGSNLGLDISRSSSSNVLIIKKLM
jgi:hypothetical protein